MKALENITEEELRQLCRSKGISKRDTKIAIMYFIEREKPLKIWEWCLTNHENMEYASIYKLLNRLKKKLTVE